MDVIGALQQVETRDRAARDVSGEFLGFDSEKGSIADAMIECIDATAIPVCMVGLLYALPNTQLTRRLAREERLYPPDYVTGRAAREGIGDQCTGGLNFETARRRRDILLDYRTVLAGIYEPHAYYQRVRAVAQLLDRPKLDRSARRDPPPHRFLSIPVRDIVLVWRLVSRIAARQPRALWPFLKVFRECARDNPRAVEAIGMLAGIYLHLGPFSRFVMAMVDREIARCDSGEWRSPLASPGAPKLMPPQARVA